VIGAIAEKLGGLFNQTATPRAEIKQARGQIRAALASRPALERALEEAEGRVAMAEAALAAVGPAQAAAAAAEAADAEDRKQRVLDGKVGADPKLSEAVTATRARADDAERMAEAARAVLPTLAERVRDAKQALKSTDERIDSAAWRIAVAELAADAAAAQQAADVVATFQKRVTVLTDVGLRHKLYGTPNGSVPAELKKIGELPKVSVDSLRAQIKDACERLRALRTDADA
jgi:chromosome segregation ATPase